MKNVLIDTDVILDFFFDRKPFSDFAAKIFGLCEKKQIQGFITPVIISNTYYLLKQTASHDKVIKKLKGLFLITNILIMDADIIGEALISEFKDFEDALQYQAALKHSSIHSIVTRNVKDYKKSQIGVLTPESFIKLINNESD